MKSSLVVLQYKYIPASIVVQAGIQIIYNAICSFCQPFLLSVVDCMFFSTGVTSIFIGCIYMGSVMVCVTSKGKLA